MSLNNKKGLVPANTFNGNSTAAGFQRAVGQATNATDIKSRFSKAAPRDRFAVTINNVPGLKNGADDFAVRAHKDASVTGGIVVRVNCFKLSAGDWRGAKGKEAVAQYVKAHSAAAAANETQLGQAAGKILADRTLSQYQKQVKLAALVPDTSKADAQLTEHLYSIVIQTVEMIKAVLAPLPAGI